MRAARHLLVGVVVGAALFAGERAIGRAARSPAAAERSDEALLADAARAAGLGRGDAFLAETLASRVGFLAAPDASPEARRAEAVALGIDARDPAVQARLAALLAARIRDAAARAPVDERALAAWFDARRERWRRSATVDFVHVFFTGPDARARAAVTRERIAREGVAPEAAARLGAPSLYGGSFSAADAATLGARLGPAFAAAVLDAPVGAWSGPIDSSQGAHLVWVRSRTPARDVALDEVRGAVESAWRTERAEAALAAALAALRADAGAPQG